MLKLKRDEPLSSFAFKFNLRRYSLVFDQRVFLSLNPFNMYVAQPEAGAYTRPLFCSILLNLSLFRHKTHPITPPNTPEHLLNTPYTTLTCTPYPSNCAYGELRSGRV